MLGGRSRLVLTGMLAGFMLLVAPLAQGGQWSKGDLITLRWACPNIRGTQRAHAYFARGPVSDRDAQAYLKRIGCYAGKGLPVRLDAALLPSLTMRDGRPATIWRVLAEGRVMYAVVIDESGPRAL